MEAFDQFRLFEITDKEASNFFAPEMEADLKEWALKVVLLIPDLFSTFLTHPHCQRRYMATGLCGFKIRSKSCGKLWSSLKPFLLIFHLKASNKDCWILCNYMVSYCR